MKQRRPMTDEEMASRLVNLYLQEVARLGLKRNLGLDEVINAYYYALHRLTGKRAAMEQMKSAVAKEEQVLQHATREDVVPKAYLPSQVIKPALHRKNATEQEVREETYEERKQ